MERIKKYFECALFMLVLTGMTCLSSSLFIDGEIVAKWLCFGLWLLVFGVFNSIRTLVRPVGLKMFGDMRSMLIAFVSTSFIVAVHGLLQYGGILASTGGFRVIGSFDNPAGYAMALSMMFPFVLLGMTAEERHLRLLSQLSFVFVFVALAVTESRAGILSVLIVLVAGGHRFVTKRPLVKWALVSVWVFLLLGWMVLKADSASGRILIWNVTWDMISDHWLTGFGAGGFASEYMNYQATFLAEHPDEDWMMLADNIQHPFNEFLYMWVNYGVVAVIAMIAFFLYVFMCYRRDKTPEKSSAFYSIVAIFVFSMFSYPFKYPLTWFVLLYSFSVVVHDEEWVRKLSRQPDYYKQILSVLFIILSIMFAHNCYSRVRDEICWASTASSNTYGKEQMRCYDDLYASMKNNRYFLYNYAYALYHIGDYGSAGEILSECSLLWADYDVQILSGLVAMKQRRYADAESCFDLALRMCPNRFRPLFLKLKIAEEQGEQVIVRKYAETIVSKSVKVPSTEVMRIISYAKNILLNKVL